MAGKIREIQILHVDLPLKRKFRHAITSRALSGSIFLKVILDDGTIGYGESLPRKYVTGETTQSVTNALKDLLKEKVIGYRPGDYKELLAFIEGLGVKGGAAKCAVELALLDTYGRHFNESVSLIIGGPIGRQVVYSGVMQAGSITDAVIKAASFKLYGLRFIKVKVGAGDDLARLDIVRRISGRNANIRVDANCAWKPNEAIERIEEMRRYNISAVEQPVKAEDLEGLKKVTDAVPEEIIADESLCTISDAEKLAANKACNIFNIRLSKCGGLIDSLKIADIARQNGIGIQLGCQVGESGLLSAAGWHFAKLSSNIIFSEGSYGRLLLKEDITKEDMTIKRGGVISPVNGPGLGVNIREDILDRYTISKVIIR